MYSRITGYYRPVKNWNDGKSQEFADRVEYDLGHSHLTRDGAVAVTAAAETAGQAGWHVTVPGIEKASAPDHSTLPAGLYLIATRTCPNCKFAAAEMDAAGIVYEELLAEENVELAQRYRIMQAPTLLSVAADGSVDVIPGAAAVFQHVNAMKAQVTA